MKVLAKIIKWLKIGKIWPFFGYVGSFLLYVVFPIKILGPVADKLTGLEFESNIVYFVLFLAALITIYEFKNRKRSVQHKLAHVGSLEFETQLAKIRAHSYELSKGFVIAVKRNQFGKVVEDNRFDVAFEFIISTHQEVFFAEFLPSEIVRYIECALRTFEESAHVELYMPS